MRQANFSKRRNAQRGVALIIALFIVALVASMSYVMMSYLERDTARTTLFLRDTQAEFYAQGSISWARDQLASNLANKNENTIVDATPITLPQKEINHYLIATKIYDMQARFNINSVENKPEAAPINGLLKFANPKLSKTELQSIVRAIADWVRPESRDSEFEKYYLQLNPPYQVARRPMLTPTELYLVKGITPQLYAALKPYITALPAEVKMNVQTAEAPALLTLGPTMTMEIANAIIDARHKTPFTTLQKFSNLAIVKNAKIASNAITVVSDFFLVETTVTIEKQRLVLYTLLERKLVDKKITLRIVWQSKGIW